MLDVYHRNMLTPYFRQSNIASVALILLPGLTNIYYTFRPNSPLVNVMMYSVSLNVGLGCQLLVS